MPLIVKIRSYLFLILVALAPFHSFFITWLKSAAPNEALAVTILAAWREVIVVVICGLVAIECLKEKKFPHLDALDCFIIGYCALSIVWLFFQLDNKTQWLWGFRFDVMPFIFLLAVRHAKWEPLEKYIKIAIGSAISVMVFGILHTLVLPQNFLTYFGYSMQQGPYQPELPISACQYLEHTDRVCRATSTFSSPMRYGSYLLVVLGFLFPFVVQKNKQRWFALTLAGIALASIFLTYSRSVWIGAFLLITMALFWLVPKVMLKKIALCFLGTAVIFILGIIFFAASPKKMAEIPAHWTPPPLLQTIFLRNYSTSEHWQYIQEGWRAALENPLGQGLGTAGPASFRFKKFVTENWYLQIAVEMGFAAGAIFLGILAMLLFRLLENPQGVEEKGLFLSLLGISAAGLFLHSFEETSAVLMLFGMIGIALSKKSSQ